MYFENNKNIFCSEIDELSSGREDIFFITQSVKHRTIKTDKFGGGGGKVIFTIKLEMR